MEIVHHSSMTPKIENTDATTGTMNPSSSSSSSSEVDRPYSSFDLVRIVRSRIDGNSQFQHYTDRLVALVEAVDVSVNEKARLSDENAKYGEKLAEANEKYDELVSENIELKVDMQRLIQEKHELEKLLESKSKEARAEKEFHCYYESKYNEAANRHNEAVVNAKSLKLDFNKVRKQLKESRANLGKETVARLELKNKVAALNVQLKLKDEMLNKREFNETRNRLDVSGPLQESLQELRDECAGTLKLHQAETKVKYEEISSEREIKSLKAKLVLKRSLIDARNARISELERINSSSFSSIRELQSSLDDQVVRTIENETQKRLLHEEISLLKEQYQHLTDAGISMSFESAGWDGVLRGVEQRLNVQPAAKRRRDDSEIVYDCAMTSSPPGNVEIAEKDPAEPHVVVGDRKCILM